jgi:hypothetical protein
MIEQFGVIFTGVIAVFLTQSEHATRRRYACLFGMAGQPFWFMGLEGHQWGMLIVTLLYTAAWGKGIWVHWLRRG